MMILEFASEADLRLGGRYEGEVVDLAVARMDDGPRESIS